MYPVLYGAMQSVNRDDRVYLWSIKQSGAG